MTTEQKQFITNLCQEARWLDGQNSMSQFLQYQYNGVPQFVTSITQQELDTIPQYAEVGLTVDDLAQLAYVNFQIMMLIQDKLPNIVKMSHTPQVV